MDEALDRIFNDGVEIAPASSRGREMEGRGRDLTQRELQERDLQEPERQVRPQIYAALTDMNDPTFCPGEVAAHAWMRDQGWLADLTQRGSPRRYHPDLYNPKSAIVIEFDGNLHFSSKELRYDIIRDLYLAADGHCVLRFENSECTDVPAIVANVAALFLARADIPPSQRQGSFPIGTYVRRIRLANDPSILDDPFNDLDEAQAAVLKQPISGQDQQYWETRLKERAREDHEPAYSKIRYLGWVFADLRKRLDGSVE